MTRGMGIHYGKTEEPGLKRPRKRGENSMANRSTRLTRPARSLTIDYYAN